MLGILMFFVALVLLLFGFPVAFTFGAVATFFGFVSSGFDLFTLAPQRIWSIMTNITLMAVPLFVFMGIVLQKSGLAEKLLEYGIAELLQHCQYYECLNLLERAETSVRRAKLQAVTFLD